MNQDDSKNNEVNPKIEELEATNRRLSSLIEISEEFNHRENLNKIFSAIVSGCFENLSISLLSIVYSILTSNDSFQTKIFQGVEELKEIQKNIVFNKNDPIIKAIIKLKLATNFTDLKKKHPFLENQNLLSELKPEIIIPMRTQNFFVGFLVVSNKNSELAFSFSEIQYLNMLANLACLAIENSRLHKMIVLDGQTSLFTYDYFMDQLKHDFELAIRYNHPLSVLMLDIDHFNEINDKYGYRFGNKVIKHFAFLTKAQLRKVDTIARYGGEKFAIILPMTDSKKALFATERIREKFAKQTFKCKGETFKVTISFGIVCYENGNYSNLKDFIEHASYALFYAKRNGRNQVILAEDLD